MQTCQDINSHKPITPGDGITRSIGQPASQVKSIDLLQGRRAVDIEHNGSLYRLQTTKLGKLILTK